MAETTLEEAKRCPFCDVPGEHVKTLRAQPGQTRGAQNYMFICKNERCRKYEFEYFVQVNPDGSIPPAYSAHNQPKNYPKLDPSRRDNIVAGLQRQLEIETSKEGTGEVRNPRG
jgi:hypothetical protein